MAEGEGLGALVLVMNLAAMLIGAGAVWGAVRADIKALQRDVEKAHATAARAHDRIDTLRSYHQ